MNINWRLILLTLPILSMPMLALSDLVSARTPDYTHPKQTLAGDWLTNVGPVAGKAASPETPGALWRVLVPNLNCRKTANPRSPLVTHFTKGTLLQANLGRGGSDQVLLNALDPQGHPWMWVRSQDGRGLNCFVRAHRSFIQPYPGHQ